MTFEIPLLGGGGEPVDLPRTIRSHGCVRLAPNRIAPDFSRITMPLRLREGAVLVDIDAGSNGFARVRARGSDATAKRRADIERTVRRVLRLDDDFSAFYARARGDPDLAWVRRGAGRFLRSATAFEDLVKTVCTTNCTWSATIRMVDALVETFGEPVSGVAGARVFPRPDALVSAPDAFYRDVMRAGYRGPYLRAIAQAVVAGELDLDALADAPPEAIDDDELCDRLRALPGIGPYAAAHAMLLMGRYSRLVLDSWTRPTYERLSGTRPRSDRGIERRFKPYGRFAGLAFWCYVTRDWIP